MKIKILTCFMSLSLLFSAGPALCALKTMPSSNQFTVIRDGVSTYDRRTTAFPFRMEILDENGNVKAENEKAGRPLIYGLKNERYSIRLTNPLPVRAAVNLTIDGLNSLTGKPSGISDGSKWMIDPYASIVIRGWQVNQGELRRFFFTDTPKSYATWRSDAVGRDLSVNCGVIGAAFFWNSEELQRYYDDHPQYVYTPSYEKLGGRAEGGVNSGLNKEKSSALCPDGRMDQDKKDERAGTGMGERESNPTEWVNFNANAGMYNLREALVVYYDFAPVRSLPNPFPQIGYAPEMR